MKRLVRYIIPIAAAAILAGCSTVKNTIGLGKQNPVTATDKNSQLPPATGAEIPTSDLSALQTETLIDCIIYGKWIIADAGGKAVKASEYDEAPQRPYVVFDSTAVNPFILKFYAYAGCNTVNGRLALTEGGRISRVGEFAATLRMCPDADSEADIIDALNTVVRYRIERIANNYILYFYNAAGTNTMVMRKNDMGFLDGAWDVTRIPPIDVKADDMPEPMQLVFDMTECHLHGNTGCNVLNASIKTNIDKRNSITIEAPATTRMACPNAGLEQQLVIALSKVATAEKGKNDIVNLLDEAGNTVVTLRKANVTLD